MSLCVCKLFFVVVNSSGNVMNMFKWSFFSPLECGCNAAHYIFLNFWKMEILVTGCKCRCCHHHRFLSRKEYCKNTYLISRLVNFCEFIRLFIKMCSPKSCRAHFNLCGKFSLLKQWELHPAFCCVCFESLCSGLQNVVCSGTKWLESRDCLSIY